MICLWPMVDGLSNCKRSMDGDEEWKVCFGDFDGKACMQKQVDMAHMPCLLGDFSRVSSHLGTPITANPNVLLSILCPVLIDNNQIAVEVTRKSCMSERLEIFIFYLLKERLEKAYIKMKRIINKLKKCERRSECGTLAVTEFPQTSLMNTRERERWTV